MNLTAKQQQLIGALIETTRALEYPRFTIQKCNRGVIFNYGQESGDPFVTFYDGKQAIVPFDSLIIVQPGEVQ